MYMAEPSSGDHYTLLSLTGGKDITIGALSAFVAAKFDSGIQTWQWQQGSAFEAPCQFRAPAGQ